MQNDHPPMRCFALCWAVCLVKDWEKMEQSQNRLIRGMKEILSPGEEWEGDGEPSALSLSA